MIAPRPKRRPLACGALGRFDRQRVLRAARELDPALQVVHEGPGAILLLDRPAIEWSANGVSGLAWTERVGPVDARRIASWRDAATKGAGAGLELSDGGALVHSSVSGVAPVYHLDEPGVTYFASRIDPLVAAAPRPLTCDWEAWASILTIGHPMGSRTPFAEVRRLGPFSTLAIRGGSVAESAEPWPWAEVEPVVPVDRAAADTAAAMRTAVGRLPEGQILCPLSGGWDSRLILRLLVDRRRDDVDALTVSHHDGAHPEELIADEVARRLEVRHEVVASVAKPWWPAVRWAALQVDFQQPLFRWHLQLMERLRGSERTITDGFGLDSLACPRWVGEEAAAAGGSKEAAKGTWDSFSKVPKQLAAPAYTHALRRAMLASARRQFMSLSEQFAGNPNRAFLSEYWARQVRGTACRPAMRLGSEHLVATPFVEDEVARATLSAPPSERASRKMYQAIFNQIDPRLWVLQSTNDDRPGVRRATSRPAAADVRDYAEVLAATPLAPYLGRRARTFLTRPRNELQAAPGPAYRPYLFALWYERYRDRIREPDPADLLA